MKNIVLTALIAFALTLISGCTNSGTDGGNCSRTSNCPTDAGQMTVDAGQTNHDTSPDANTTPDASVDACAAYTNVPSDGWQCTSGSGGSGYSINNVKMVVENGICLLRSQQVWCQNTPPAADVNARQFTCTDIGTQVSVTCWHNNL